MSDGEEPKRPRPAAPPAVGQPLPRLWKAEPTPDEEADAPKKSRRERLLEEKEREEAEKSGGKSTGSKPKAKSTKDKDKAKPKPKPKGALLEETPELDTYETRQRARLLVGGLLAAVAVTGIVLGLRSLGGGSSNDDDVPDEGTAVASTNAPPPSKPDNADLEARNLMVTAGQLAKNGKTSEAIAVLNKVTKSYPKTPSARDAREALDRPARNLPLFLGEDTVVATPGAGKAPRADTGPTVTADGTRATIRPGTGDAQLRLPANPAEPPRAGTPVGTAGSAVAAKALPQGFQAREETGIHASGWPNQITSDRDGATMVLIPAGLFTQGRDDGLPDEGPEHKVALGPYYMDQHEVTNRQYAYYLKETGKKTSSPAAKDIQVPDKQTGKKASNPATKDAEVPEEEKPVVNVSSREAKAYCEWSGKRLPTEAQWEAAARTTDGRIHPWGSNPPIWSRARAPRQIDTVMEYPLDMSPYGVFDLAGNAWEWTADWFDSKYYVGLRGQSVTNPAGPASSRARPPQVTVKGGSKAWTAAWREGLKVDTKLPYVGFRGVLIVEDTAPTALGSPTPGQPSAPTPAPNRNGVVPF